MCCLMKANRSQPALIAAMRIFACDWSSSTVPWRSFAKLRSWEWALDFGRKWDATNVILTTMAETGVIGLCAFLLIHVVLIKMVWRTQYSFQRTSWTFSCLAIGACAANGEVCPWIGRSLLESRGTIACFGRRRNRNAGVLRLTRQRTRFGFGARAADPSIAIP